MSKLFNYKVILRKENLKAGHPNDISTKPSLVQFESLGVLVTPFQIRSGERVNGRLVISVNYLDNTTAELTVK